MKRVVILFLGFLILLGGNCTKNPTGPGSARAPILYVMAGLIYFIDTATDSIVDSMSVSGNSPYFRGVSPDGSKLYLMDQVIDTKTKTVIAGARTGVPTPDGKYLLYTGIGPFQVIEAQTNQVLYSDDTLNLGVYGTGREFDAKNGLVYGALGDKIGVFDYRRLEYVRTIDPGQIGGLNWCVNDIVVSRDGRKLYYVCGEVYSAIDLVRDTVIDVLILDCGNYAWLGVRPDDRYIYITDLGNSIVPPEPCRKILIYSPFTETFLQPIVPCYPIYDTVLCGGPVGQIALTPDGRKAYVPGGPNFLSVIDTRTNQVIKLIELPRSVSSLTVQRKYNFLEGDLP